MSILNFMPQFVPWYTKSLLKKDEPEIEDAKQPSTGFFGDVFDYIDDAFTWTPNPEPETNWGGGQLGAGFGEQAPAYEPYIEPDYSGMGDPFGMNDPFTEEDWTSAPSTPSPWTGPILGGMFGSAPPSPGIGSAIGGSLGSGEGWGFDLIDEPAQSWDMYAPPPTPAPWTGGVTGGMFAPPEPMSFPDIGNQWGSAWNDWSAPPEPAPFASDLGFNFRDSLANSLSRDEAWADVQDMRATPAPELGASSWDALPLSGVPGNGIGSAIGDTFSGFGSNLGARIQEPIDLQQWEPWGGEWAGGVRGAGVVTPEYSLRNDWSMFGNGDAGLGMMPDGWDQMSPQERGEYVYFSGLKGEDYLSDSDWARMSPDLQQRIGYADSRIEGGINNGFASLWNTIETPFNAAYETVGDLVVDPILQPLDSTGNRISPFQKDFWSKGPSLSIGTSTPSQVDFAIPLEDTVQNIQDATNPWDFLETQSDAFKERPLLQQVGIPLVTPGSGIYKNIEGVPQWIRAVDAGIDFIQGGSALDNIGSVPGASGAFRNVIAPGAVGFVGGAATDAIFDPTFSDQWGNEYNPNWWEMGLTGSGLAIGGNAALRVGTTPFGSSIDEVGNFVLPKALSGAKPGYGFGDKNFTLQFKDDLDKALYIVRNISKKSKSDEQYMTALREYFPGLDDVAIRAKGDEVASSIKELAKVAPKPAGKSGPLEIPSIVRQLPDVTSVLDEAVPTVPTASIADGFIEDPAEALIRQQQDIFATDPLASAPFTTPGAVTPSASQAADAAATPPRSATVEQTVSHINDILKDRGNNEELRRSAFNKWQAQVFAEAPTNAEAKRILSNVRMETFGPDTVPLTFDQGEALKATLKAKAQELGYGPFVSVRAEKAVDALVAGSNGYPSDLRHLRNLLTDTPYSAATADAIESVAPSPAAVAPSSPSAVPAPSTVTTADGVVLSAPPTPKVPVADVAEPGMTQSLDKTIKELDQTPLSAAEREIAGADDALFPDVPRTPITNSIPDGVSGTAYQPSMDSLIETPRPVGGVKPEQMSPAEVVITDAGKTYQRQFEVPKNLQKTVFAWEDEALAEAVGKPTRQREEILDRLQRELGERLKKETTGGNAFEQAVRARDRVAEAIAVQDRAVVDEAITEWRRLNIPEFDDIKMFANTSWGERWVGGSLKNKLANRMTERGRDLVQWLENQGYTLQEAKDITEDELSNYLEIRTMREAQNGNKNAILDHALTQLHMGDFQPKIDGANVPVGTGQVPKVIDIGRTANAGLKGLFFGMADMGVILGNALPAVVYQGVPISVGYLNSMLKLVDIDDASKYRAFSGSAMGASQDVFDDKVGTLIGVAGRAAQGPDFSRPLGNALVAIDKPAVKWNQLLEKAQFDWLLNKGLRQPAYDGNLVIAKMLGMDINDPKLQRAIARMTNAATSTAPLARENTRRSLEGASLGSARFLRAQGDFLLAAAKLVNPRASAQERVVAMTAVASIVTAIAIARELAGERLDLNPFRDGKPNPNFGNITFPDGTVMPLFNQTAMAQTAFDSIVGLANVVRGEGGIEGITDPIIKYMINRQGPMFSWATRNAGIGFDPDTKQYNWPGHGPGFGSEMSGEDKFRNSVPVPVGVSGFLRSEDSSPLSKGLNLLGGNTYPQDKTIAALNKEGFESWKQFEEKDPDSYYSRREEFFKKYEGEIDDKYADSAIRDYEKAQKANSEEFMQSKYNYTVKDWSDERKRIADGKTGVYNELGLEEKERPEEDGSKQWLYDYNQTFSQALKDPGNPASGLNTERLGELQAEYWAKHPDPKVRKEVLDYQLARAETEADKLFIKSMARLQGIDPNTGAPLTTKSGKRTMPNYFTMDRYEWNEVNNEDARDVLARFVQWRDSLPEVVVEDMKREDLIKMFIEKVPDQAYRPDSKPWTPAAIRDVITYGRDTAETPEFTAYKEQMRPELLWFSPDKTWKTIKEANDKAGRN